MKTYNRSLDCVTLAMAFALKGETVKAAAMFHQATKQPDAKRGIAVLEASNKAAYAATAKVQASRKVTAGDDLDIGEDEDLDALIDDASGDVGEVEEEVEVDSAMDEDEDDEEEEDQFDGAEFAKVLAGMVKAPAKASAKAKRR